jgi:hypothetical protein
VRVDARAAPDERARAAHGEQLAQQAQRVHDRRRHAVGHELEELLDLLEQHRLAARETAARDESLVVGREVDEREGAAALWLEAGAA